MKLTDLILEQEEKRPPKVQIGSYTKPAGDLKIYIDGRVYRYAHVPPTLYDKFKFLLTKNVGRALALARKFEQISP